MTPTTRIVRMTELGIGDKITEVDTPSGPFYTVVRQTPASVFVRYAGPDALDDDEPVMRFGRRANAEVRVTS